MKLWTVLLTAPLSAILAVACGGLEPTPTSMPEPAAALSATPTFTLAPTPTPTLTPSPIPVPAPSPTPTPTVTPEVGQGTAAFSRVTLPPDDGPHPTNAEWWYYNGHLMGEDGSRYGFHYVFFKLSDSFLLGQFAITDHQAHAFSHDERFGPLTANGPVDGFHVALSDWEMSGFAGEYNLEASQADYTVDLRLSSKKPAALHGGDGVVEFKATRDSFYYSYTRLEVGGTINDHGVIKEVTGTAWMDHQWGDFQSADINWDWFSLQLEDNTEVMFFDVRDRQQDTLISFATYVDPQGNVTQISREEFIFQSTGTWNSPFTNATYPVGWQAHFRSLGLSLTLTPIVSDAEIYVETWPSRSYWEGEVMVTGERDGQPIEGVGFAEMVDYVS